MTTLYQTLYSCQVLSLNYRCLCHPPMLHTTGSLQKVGLSPCENPGRRCVDTLHKTMNPTHPHKRTDASWSPGDTVTEHASEGGSSRGCPLAQDTNRWEAQCYQLHSNLHSNCGVRLYSYTTQKVEARKSHTHKNVHEQGASKDSRGVARLHRGYSRYS